MTVLMVVTAVWVLVIPSLVVAGTLAIGRRAARRASRRSTPPIAGELAAVIDLTARSRARGAATVSQGGLRLRSN